MEKQYYTPKINQFHIGFRYERRNHDNTWRKTEFTTADNLSYFETCLNDGTFRVKVLDHEDIIEAGWELTGRFYSLERVEFNLGLDELNAYGISNGERYFYITKINDLYMIYTVEVDAVLFKGKIANYNELLKVTDMLRIKNTI